MQLRYLNDFPCVVARGEGDDVTICAELTTVGEGATASWLEGGKGAQKTQGAGAAKCGSHVSLVLDALQVFLQLIVVAVCVLPFRDQLTLQLLAEFHHDYT